MQQIRLILPKRRNGLIPQIYQTHKPGERLYFLGGPIRGAHDWHAEAIKLLFEKDPYCYIACPRRYDENHELYRSSLEAGEQSFEYPNQTTWERHWLNMASQQGSVIFWLPCEDQENPRKKEDGPYARDTYGELGRWSLRSAYGILPLNADYCPRPHQLNLVVGAEADFPGLSVIKKNFDDDHRDQGKTFTFCESLELTINEAVKLGKKFNPQPLFNSENC